MLLRVYPRAKDIGPNYSGCQLLMAQDKDSWVVVSYTEGAKGDPVRIWSQYERDPAKLACRYRNGRIVSGSEDICPAPEFVLLKSLAQGCFAAIQEEIRKKELGTPWPPGCKYE
jgi:hypothetical protein